MGDASKSSNIPDFFQRSGKRVRTDAEEIESASEGSDIGTTPTQSKTDLSDGFSTAGSTASIPAIRINNVNMVNSVDTVVSPSQLDKDKERLAFKLDKLHDKVRRYESHATFLKKDLPEPYTDSPTTSPTTTSTSYSVFVYTLCMLGLSFLLK